MNETRKSPSLLDAVGEIETFLRDKFVARPLEWYSQAREKMRNFAGTNFELGCDFAEQGLINDALFRFKLVLKANPSYPLVWYNIGCCYYKKGDLAKAADALKTAREQDPTNRDATYLLSAIEPSAVPLPQRPTRMARAMVLPFFARLAPQYDAVELENQYQGGQLVFDAMKSLTKIPAPVVLDLGCGTGIAARPWRAVSKAIMGVDMSPEMLAQANAVSLNGVKLFDATREMDIAESNAEALDPASADIVLCVNTASYVGDLKHVVAIARHVLRPGGLLAITSEAYRGDGFGLDAASGRFGHNPAYIKQLVTQAGFSTVREQRIDLYPNTPSQFQVFQLS